MKRFLGLTDSEVAENERMWREENDENLNLPPTDASAEMRGAGVSGAGIEADLDAGVDEAPDTTEPTVEPEGQTGDPEAATTAVDTAEE